MAFFDLQKAREQYLEKLLARYGTVTLPIETARLALPLHTVFQPMILQRDPLAPRDEQSGVASEVVKAKDGAEALTKSKYRRMVVLGGPGMGKTTALKALLYIAISTAQIDPAAPLPLFISLPDLMRAKLSFAEYIQHVMTELDIDPRFASILTTAINTSNAFLCLDSLDEVLPTLRPEVIAFLNQEALRCQGTWIIGSRFTEYKGGQFAHSQFAEWELQGLSELERLTLARQLLPALYTALYANVAQNLKPALPSAENYIEELQQSTQIAAWGENPLLLSLTAVLYVQTGRLPTSRAVLYAQVTEAMFTMRIHDDTQRAELRQLLAEIALEFYQTRGRNFSVTDVLEFLPALISDQQSLNATLALILDSGVLEPVAHQVYGFKHQMFQEYLVAVALAHRCVDTTQRQSTWELLCRKRRLSRWNEILCLLVGILVQEHGAEGLQVAHEWLSALALEYSTSEGDPGNLCLILALKSLGEFGEHALETEVADLAQHIMEIWEKTFVELLRQRGWRNMQPNVVQALVGIAEYIPLETILPLLKDNNELVRHAAIRILTGMGERVPLETILPLLKDNNELVRHTAIDILARMGERASLHEFVTLLRDPEQTLATCCKVLWALGELGTPAALDLLMEALADEEEAIRSNALLAMRDDDIELRRGGFRAIKEHGAEIPFEPLFRLLNDPNDTIISTTIAVLGELGSMGMAVPIEPLVALLEHEDEFIAGEAAEALCKFGERIPIDILLAKMLETDEEQLRDSIFYGLSSLGTRIPLDTLLAILTDIDLNTGSGSIEYGLKNLAESMPGQILQRLHDDPRPLMRRIVLYAIQTSKACEWLPLVLATLDDVDDLYAAHDRSLHGNNETMRSLVIETLGALNACAPLEPLLQFLHTNIEEFSYKDERIVVLEALRQFGSRVPLTALWPLLGSDHADICRPAFEHLQETHPAALKELVPELRAIANGEPVQGAFAARMHYRFAETVALMGRATPAVLEMIIDLLDHPFWEVQVRAAKTLGTVRRNIPDSTIRRLLEMRKDPASADVRVAADQALAEILSLEQGMEDESSPINGAGARAR